GRLVAGWRELVPRAHRQTMVAAEDAVADRGAQLARNRPLVLDGEVRDAAARIEPIGCGKRRRRADVKTSTTSAAVIDLRRVRRQIERGEDRAEKQPRAELARDQIRVLALPPEAGGGGERLLHHRRGVDENLHVAAGLRSQPTGQCLEAELDEVVVVVAARVDRDRAAVAPPQD